MPLSYPTVEPMYENSTGLVEASGSRENLNQMLQRLRYVSQVKFNELDVLAGIELSDKGVNYPVAEQIEMIYFRENQPPVCSQEIKQIKIKAGANFDYNIPLRACVDADDSIDGLGLKYHAYLIAAKENDTLLFDNSSFKALPEWLTFNQALMRLTGRALVRDGFVYVGVNASDGYEEAALLHKLVFEKRDTYPNPTVLKEIETIIANAGEREEKLFAPNEYFVDPDHDDMDIVITFTDVPSWIRITPDNITINPFRLGDHSGEYFRLTIEATSSDANTFSTHKGAMTVWAKDVYNGTSLLKYRYEVHGSSTIKRIVSYVSAAIGVCGTAFTIFMFRNKLYNALAWDRYRYKHSQFGRDNLCKVTLFAVKRDEGLDSGISRWSTRMPKEL